MNILFKFVYVHMYLSGFVIEHFLKNFVAIEALINCMQVCIVEIYKYINRLQNKVNPTS